MTQYSKTQLVDKSGHIDISMWQEWHNFTRGCRNNVITVKDRIISVFLYKIFYGIFFEL